MSEDLHTSAKFATLGAVVPFCFMDSSLWITVYSQSIVRLESWHGTLHGTLHGNVLAVRGVDASL
jgi:hypothetical protein